MPPSRKFDTSAQQLVRLLAEARDAHLSFEEAWTLAVRPDRPLVLTNSVDAPAGAVRWPTDTATRHEDIRAINSTRDSWRRAYEQRPPTVREAAAARLLPLLAEMSDVDPPPGEGARVILSRAGQHRGIQFNRNLSTWPVTLGGR